MFGRNKDTKRELTPQEQKIVIDGLNEIINNAELIKDEIIKTFEVSDGLVEYDGYERDMGDIKVIKAKWTFKTYPSNDERFNKIQKLWETYDNFKEKIRSKYHIKCFDWTKIMSIDDEHEEVVYFFYKEDE